MKVFTPPLFGPLSQFWNRLTLPHKAVVEVGLRRQAQFLAALSVLIAVLVGLQIIVAAATDRTSLTLVLTVLLLCILLAYGLSRSSFPQAGAVLLVYGFTVFAFVLCSLETSDIATIMYGMIPIAYLLSSALLAIGWQVALVALVLLGSVSLGLWLPRFAANENIVVGNLIATGVVLLITSLLRNEVERRRLDQVRQINCELAATHDALEREQALLRSSAARIRGLLSTIPDMIFEISRDGVFLDYMPSSEFASLMPPEQFLGRNIAEIMPPEVATTSLRAVQQTLDGAEVQTFEYQLALNDTCRTYEARVAASRPDAALAIIRDVTERKGAEEALRRSEDKFAKAFRTSPDAINITRMRDGQYLEINDGFTAMTGYMPAEVIGKTSLEINLWADPQTGTGLRQALKEHGEVIGLEAEFRTKDGSIRTGLMSARLIDVSGEPCVLSITRDITARERTEERIEQVNHLQGNLLAPLSLTEKLKLITDGVISIFGADFARIWITQPGDLCDANCVHAKVIEGPHVCRYRDRCLHLMSSSGRYTHINGKMHQRVPFNCYKIGRIAAGADSRFITNDVVHDARVHDRAWASELGLVSFAGYQLLSAAGQSMGVLALFSKHAISIDEDALLESIANTTAQVLQTARVEQALAQERNLLRTLIDNLPDAIYVKDTDCRKTLANHADVRNMRLESEAEALGKSDFEAYSQELAAKLYADDQMILKTGQPVLDREEIIDEVGGRQRWLLTSKLPLWDNAGQIVGIVGIGHDITERKRAEAEREKLIADLETKNAELERFTYTVSHDLKAPLITIRGFLGLLEKDTQTGNAEQMLADKQRIVEATDKMQRLLNELLELSRIGRLMNPPEAVEFATIVEGACKLVQGRLEVRGVEVTAAKDLPTVYGDRARLVEVVQNLVDNAAKFMGDQAEPRITIGQQGTDRDGRPIFFVRDNGQGIESQYHERIFGLFEKLDPYSEGTGIGLALVKRIVEVHGGRIWLESAGTNQGTTFFFALPCPPDDELRLER